MTDLKHVTDAELACSLSSLAGQIGLHLHNEALSMTEDSRVPAGDLLYEAANRLIGRRPWWMFW